MLPLKDENPTSRRAVITFLLILANVAVYFLIQQPARTEGEDTRFTFEYAAIPCEVVTGRPLSEDEVLDTLQQGDETACDRQDQDPADEVFPDKRVWLAVLSSMFLHGGLLHLGSNMLFLWIFGNNIEDHLGVLRYIGFYLLSGAVAALAHIGVQPDSTVPVIGASGAVAGVMGAYLVWFPNAQIRSLFFLGFFIFFRDISAKWLLGFWFVLQFFTGSDSGVAWLAHVGGFVFGVLVGLLVRASRGARQAMWRDTYVGRGPGYDPFPGQDPYRDRRFGGRQW